MQTFGSKTPEAIAEILVRVYLTVGISRNLRRCPIRPKEAGWSVRSPGKAQNRTRIDIRCAL